MKIFISAVTSEFGRARDKLASDFRARGHQVAVQSDFQQKPDSETLLGTLADYIRDCHAVICVIGKRSGASPPAKAANQQNDPRVLPTGINEASYTQWEFFLARYYKRRPFVYLATDEYKPDRDAPNDNSALQDAYLAHLKAEGVQYTSFSTAEELRIAALRDEPKIASDPAPVRQSTIKPIVLPYPSLGPLFKGREGFMQQLHDSLSRGGQTAITSKALYGLGGIGKTRAAVEYAWAHRNDYSALLFVVAETPEALRRNFAALATTLVPELETTDDTLRLQAVLDWLNGHPGWFLMLDNVDTPTSLAEADALLAKLVGGHLLLTSRLSNFSANFEPLPLDVLSPEDATAFLLDRTKGRRRGTADDENKACEAARHFDRLALALEQAGAYIAKHRLTFEEYLERWKSKRDEVLSWFDETVTGYPRAVAATWQTSVAQLTEPGRRLLERLAWLAPEKVPEFLLDVPITSVQNENLHEALADLAAYSLVTRDAEGPFFLVHRLVQDVTRRSLAGDRRQKSLAEALSWINAAFPRASGDVREWPRAEALAPHARTVSVEAESGSISKAAARLMNQIGMLQYSKARYADAETDFQRSLALTEKAFGMDHPNVGASLNNLAELYKSQGRYTEAEPLCQRSLAIRENALGKNHVDVSTSLNNLAALYRLQGRYAEAEPLFQRALLITEKELGKEHPSVGTSLNNLAVIYRAQGRHAEAEQLYQRDLAIGEKTLGKDHPDVGITLNNLAGLYGAQGRYADAEPLYQRSLAIRESALGQDHPDVGLTLNNLARSYAMQGRYAEAESLYRRAIIIFAMVSRQMRRQHPSLETVVDNYMELLSDRGETEAEVKAEREKLMRWRA